MFVILLTLLVHHHIFKIPFHSESVGTWYQLLHGHFLASFEVDVLHHQTLSVCIEHQSLFGVINVACEKVESTVQVGFVVLVPEYDISALFPHWYNHHAHLLITEERAALVDVKVWVVYSVSAHALHGWIIYQELFQLHIIIFHVHIKSDKLFHDTHVGVHEVVTVASLFQLEST